MRIAFIAIIVPPVRLILPLVGKPLHRQHFAP